MHEQLEESKAITIIQSFIGGRRPLMGYPYSMELILTKTLE